MTTAESSIGPRIAGLVQAFENTTATAGSLAVARRPCDEIDPEELNAVGPARVQGGRKVLALAAALALAAILIVGCSSTPAPEWTVRQDPGGLGFWAGPAGGPEKFYPSAYSNPVVNRAGGPDR